MMPSRTDRMQAYFKMLDESDLALRVTDGKKRVWLPKSQISVTSINGPNGPVMNISLPVWLAKKTGIMKQP